MNLRELCKNANIDCELDLDIKEIKSNSSEVEKGDLFVCINGLHKDGHDYAKEAVERGAAAIVAERRLDVGIPILYTDNTRRVLSPMYDAYYGYPTKKLKLVALTGTNGKTSVTHMIRAILDAAMYKTGLIGTVNSYSGDRLLSARCADPMANMTTPDPSQLFEMLSEMVKDGVEYAVMEASSHALALDKLEGLEFEAAVFTNLTPEHLDFHGDMESYYLAKKKLFGQAKRRIINIDDSYGKRLYSEYRDGAVGCSITRKCADCYADDIKNMGTDGFEYRLVCPTKQFLLRTPLVGSFSVMNTLEAAACALELGVPPSSIKCALSSMCGVSGRLEKVKLGAIVDFSVFIDYAHTPDALENLLDTVCRIRRCDQRVVLLFGCGGDRDKSKRSKMGEIAARYADFTMVTSDNSRSEEPSDIIARIVSGMKNADYKVIENRAEAIDHVIKNAQKGDMIILAGKGHEEYEIDKNGRHRFSEKEIAAEAVRKYFIHKE